jgi:hypothetical protein
MKQLPAPKRAIVKHPKPRVATCSAAPCGGCAHLKKQLFGLKKFLIENEKLVNDLVRAADPRSAYSSSPAPPGNDFLKKKFAELYCKVKEDTECVSCMDELTVDTIEVLNCGHVICKGCHGKIIEVAAKEKSDSKCPMCRKVFQVARKSNKEH